MNTRNAQHVVLALVGAAGLLGCSASPTMNGAGPKVSSTVPAAMETNVSLSTTVSVEFSAAMEQSSVAVTLTPSTTLTNPTWNEESTVVTYELSAPLQPGVQYVLRVLGTDPSGNKLTGDTAFAFATANPPEMTAPALVSSTPMEAATNVATSATLALTFNEAIDKTSLQLTTLPSFDWGDQTWSTDGTTVTFASPPVALSMGTNYTVSIVATDLANNALPSPTLLTFSTAAAPDTMAPTVVSTSPSPGATNVTPNIKPSVTFSEAMQPGATASLQVSPDAGCTATLDSTGTTLTCERTGNLSINTLHSVTVLGTSAKDLAGNAMAADYTFTFTTGAAPDVMPPTLVSVTPAPNATGVSRASPITFSFNEPMDKVATQTAFALSAPTNKQLFFSWNDGGTSVSVRVDGGYAYGDQAVWGLSSNARDLAGNALSNPDGGTFRAIRSCQATVASTNDGTGARSQPLAGAATYAFKANTLTVGHYSANNNPSIVHRGLVQFDLNAGGTGCSTTAVTGSATAITAATMSLTQTGVTGTPFAPTSAAIDMEPIEIAKTMTVQDALYSIPRCMIRNCRVDLFSTSTAPQTRTIDMTSVTQAAFRNTKQLQLRLVNPEAEKLSSANYSTLAPGAAATNNARLSVTYEYP